MSTEQQETPAQPIPLDETRWQRKRRLDREPISSVRHTIGFPVKGANEVSDRVALTLDIAARISLRLQQMRPTRGAVAPVALAGPLALAVLGSARKRIQSHLQLVIAHGSPEQIRDVVRELSRFWPAHEKQLAQELVRSATYLQLSPERHHGAPSDAYPPATAPSHRAERAYRVLMHTAFKTSTTSRIQISRASASETCSLTLMHPDGILLAQVAHVGRLEWNRRAIASLLLGQTDISLTNAQVEKGRAVLETIQRELRLLQLTTESFVRDCVGVRSNEVFHDYPQLRDPFLDDVDVKQLCICAAGAFDSTLDQQLFDVVWALNTQARQRQHDAATNVMATQTNTGVTR